MDLTLKQEKFAQEWHKTGNKSEAYRRAYPTSQNWKESAVNTQATILSRNSKVLERFAQLQAESAKRNETDVDTIDKMLKTSWQMAKNINKPSAMVSAAAALAKLHGLNQPEKRDVRVTEESPYDRALRERAGFVE